MLNARVNSSLRPGVRFHHRTIQYQHMTGTECTLRAGTPRWQLASPVSGLRSSTFRSSR